MKDALLELVKCQSLSRKTPNKLSHPSSWLVPRAGGARTLPGHLNSAQSQRGILILVYFSFSHQLLFPSIGGLFGHVWRGNHQVSSGATIGFLKNVPKANLHLDSVTRCEDVKRQSAWKQHNLQVNLPDIVPRRLQLAQTHSIALFGVKRSHMESKTLVTGDFFHYHSTFIIYTQENNKIFEGT